MQSGSGGRRQVPGFDPPDHATTNQPPARVDEVLQDVRAPLIVHAMATAHDAARLRHELTAWLAVDVPDDPLDDLVLAAYGHDAGVGRDGRFVVMVAEPTNPSGTGRPSSPSMAGIAPQIRHPGWPSTPPHHDPVFHGKHPVRSARCPI
jgi:hypothetical protein